MLVADAGPSPKILPCVGWSRAASRRAWAATSCRARKPCTVQTAPATTTATMASGVSHHARGRPLPCCPSSGMPRSGAARSVPSAMAGFSRLPALSGLPGLRLRSAGPSGSIRLRGVSSLMAVTPQNTLHASHRRAILRWHTVHVVRVVPDAHRLIGEPQHEALCNLMDDDYVALHVPIHHALATVLRDPEDRGNAAVVGDAQVREPTVVPCGNRRNVVRVRHDLHRVAGIAHNRRLCEALLHKCPIHIDAGFFLHLVR